MAWDRQLDTATFRSIPFEVERIDDSIMRRIAQYKYPWRDGADLEDIGRDPRRTSLTAVFYGDDYETSLSEFMLKVDEGKKGLFVHPVLGSWQARLNISSIQHEPGNRDACTVQVEVLEDGTSTELPELFSITALEDEVLTEAAALTAANTDNIAKVTSAVTEAVAFAAAVRNKVKQAAQLVNRVRKTLDDAIDTVQELTDVENYQIVRSCKRLAYSCQKLGTRVQSSRGGARKRQIPAEVPLAVLAHRLYGDWTRSEELQEANRVRNPMLVERGSEVTTYGE